MIEVPESLVKAISKIARELPNSTDFGYVELDESDVYDEMTKIVLINYASIEPELRELTLLAIVVNLMTQITVRQLEQEVTTRRNLEVL